MRSSGANASISLRRLIDCCGLPKAGDMVYRGEAATTIEEISEPKLNRARTADASVSRTAHEMEGTL